MAPAAPLADMIPGPFGPIHVAATERGVVAVEWLADEDGFAADLRKRLGVGPVTARAARPDDPRATHLRTALTALATFLDGHAPATLPAFDLADRPAWDRAVLLAVAEVPWGKTSSYGRIALRIGAPRAARAVGGALGRNPISLLIPCHRVIAGDGTIGGYGGDAWGSREDRQQMKRDLLMREGVTVATAAR